MIVDLDLSCYSCSLQQRGEEERGIEIKMSLICPQAIFLF